MGRARRRMWLQLKAETRLEDDRLDKLRGAITRLTVGSFIVSVGALLLLREAGIIQNKIDILPWTLITFGALITVGAIDRLRRWR
jgi:hypothetical protein